MIKKMSLFTMSTVHNQTNHAHGGEMSLFSFKVKCCELHVCSLAGY
jgi:hypothetical protein